VPIVCLTATATDPVVANVKHVLGMHDCVIFKQSFNRTNIHYEVRAKSSSKSKSAAARASKDGEDAGVISQIANWVQANYPHSSGIIYCLSKKDCESVASDLSQHGLSVDFYHAGLDASNRRRVQDAWSKDKTKIIVATIAFGMGINKPDVRFVIHHTLPKSLESYYQECGRAGRDGKPAHSIIYYSYAQKHTIEHMIKAPDRDENAPPKNPETIRKNIKKLYEVVRPDQTRSTQRMAPSCACAYDRVCSPHLADFSPSVVRFAQVSYCENNVDCRRVLTLGHFGENFDRAECRKSCDNCESQSPGIYVKVTSYAQAILRIVKELSQRANTCKEVLVQEIFRGSKAKSCTPYTRSGKTHTMRCDTVTLRQRRVLMCADRGAVCSHAVVRLCSVCLITASVVRAGR
jgi:bloom syndrome protein